METASLTTSELANVLRFLAWPLVLVVVVLSLALALFVRARYVAAIIRLQGQSGTPEEFANRVQTDVPALRLLFEDLGDAGQSAGASEILRLRRRALVAQVARDLAFWYTFLFVAVFGPVLLATAVYATRTGDSTLLVSIIRMGVTAPFGNGFAPREWPNLLFFGLYIFGPPAVVCVGQTALHKKYVYVPVAAAAGLLLYATSRSSVFTQPIVFAAVLGTFAIAVTVLQDPRVRGAAAPLIVALLLAFAPWTAGLFIWAAQGAEAQDSTTSDLAELVVFSTIVLLTAATVGGILIALARGYERKRFSDVELGRVAFWLLAAFAGFGFAAIANTGGTGGLVALAQQVVALAACWFIFGYAGRAGLRQLLRGAPPSIGGLLLLRVFKRPARSEAFIDRLLSYWRFAAPVYLIGGADLAGANIEPDEFFAFIRRRLRSQFICGATQIPIRVDRLDNGRDPDGRFRVTELFCVEDVWRPAVHALIAKAAIILLDLREYHPMRAGTRHEIYQLMNLVAPERILVLVGEKDDAAVISSELRQAWMAMSDASPNRLLAGPELRVSRLRSGSAAEVKSLFSRMHAMATARAGTRLLED